MKIGQLLQIMLWWLSIFLMELEQIGAENVVVFLRDSILDKVELIKRRMNNKNMGVIKWADLFFGLREKREWRRKNVVSAVCCVRIIGSAETMESCKDFLKIEICDF